MYRQLLLTTVATAAACSTGVGIELQNPRPLDPPPMYSDWWADLASCSGRSGDMTRIEWWQATSITVNKQIVLGQWERPHRITLVDFYVENEDIVKHEMVHDLLDGDPDHRDGAWDRCDVRDPRR